MVSKRERAIEVIRASVAAVSSLAGATAAGAEAAPDPDVDRLGPGTGARNFRRLARFGGGETSR